MRTTPGAHRATLKRPRDLKRQEGPLLSVHTYCTYVHVSAQKKVTALYMYLGAWVSTWALESQRCFSRTPFPPLIETLCYAPGSPRHVDNGNMNESAGQPHENLATAADSLGIAIEGRRAQGRCLVRPVCATMPWMIATAYRSRRKTHI